MLLLFEVQFYNLVILNSRLKILIYLIIFSSDMLIKSNT